MDMSEYEGGGGGKAAGQAVGEGVAVPKTGIPDPSYVFFRRIGDGPEGPIGALGVPLSPGRSMAVDPRATPLGAPVFIDGTQPGGAGPMRRLVFAQDTGGAIRGSVRGDFFWGFGDKAGKMALATNQPVQMWLLLPKAVAGSAAASGIKTRGGPAELEGLRGPRRGILRRGLTSRIAPREQWAGPWMASRRYSSHPNPEGIHLPANGRIADGYLACADNGCACRAARPRAGSPCSKICCRTTRTN